MWKQEVARLRPLWKRILLHPVSEQHGWSGEWCSAPDIYTRVSKLKAVAQYGLRLRLLICTVK
jgi:hypothetical protein